MLPQGMGVGGMARWCFGELAAALWSVKRHFRRIMWYQQQWILESKLGEVDERLVVRLIVA